METNDTDELIAAVHRLAAAIERSGVRGEGLGPGRDSRYTRGAAKQKEVVGEKMMAELLGIPRRTLADHRLRHRLDGCWVRNGRRYFWTVAATVAAWKKGIG